MATALTHLHSPQNHLRALRYADAVLGRNSNDLEALLAKGYIKVTGADWVQAKKLFEEIETREQEASKNDEGMSLSRRRALFHSKNPLLEARGEAAWCDLQAGKVDEATEELREFIDQVDAEDAQGITSEQRARAWWRYGQALWQRGGEQFVVALNRVRFSPSHSLQARPNSIPQMLSPVSSRRSSDYHHSLQHTPLSGHITAPSALPI